MEVKHSKINHSSNITQYIYETVESENKSYRGSVTTDIETGRLEVSFLVSEGDSSFHTSFLEHPWFTKELFKIKRNFEKQKKIADLFSKN